MRGIFCLCLHSVSFPPGQAPVLTAVFWPTTLAALRPDTKPHWRLFSSTEVMRWIDLVCAAQAFYCQTWPDYKVPLSLDSCVPMLHFSGRLLRNLNVGVVRRSFDHHPPDTSVTVKVSETAAAAERSPGCPSMALSLPLGDNAFFPCHKADAVL